MELTLHYVPEGHTHWSCRVMAEHAGVSPATVQRIWDARGPKAPSVDTFKLSNDPQFESKLIDVVGLYLTARRTRPWCSAWTRRAGARH